MMAPEPDFATRIAAALAGLPGWEAGTAQIALAAAPVASPTHRAVASDCARVRRDGADPVFVKRRHADMAADIRPAMAEATRRAGALGLGPALLAQGEDVVVLADLPEPWRYARVGDLQEADTMAQVLGALRRLHGAEPLGQSFCPFGRIAALAAEARACAAPVPDDFAVLLAEAELIRAAIAAAGTDLPVVVLGAPEGDEPAVLDLAAAAGVAQERVHVRGALEDADRAAVLGAAVALVAPSELTAFPWRVVEALAVGVPVVAAESESHREVVLDGGVVGDIAAGLAEVLGSTAAVERYAVLAGDRGRAFSWLGAAERVWQLHADL